MNNLSLFEGEARSLSRSLSALVQSSISRMRVHGDPREPGANLVVAWADLADNDALDGRRPGISPLGIVKTAVVTG